MLILRVTKNPIVIAGLMCPPLTCAITQTIVATLKPNASEIWTTLPNANGHEPHATSTSSNVPMNSASNANQNLHDFTSSKLVVDILLRGKNDRPPTISLHIFLILISK